MHAAFVALSILLSQAPAVLLPCLPGDTTVACKCKQGSASACTALARADPETMKGILRLAAMAQSAQEGAQTDAKAKASDASDTGCGSGQDPKNDEKAKCNGQAHHIISLMVWQALELH